MRWTADLTTTPLGGGQADVFRFAAAGAGSDRITDLQRSIDRFDLSGGSFTNAVVNGADTILTHGGGTIRVEGVNTLTLAQWNALVVPGGSSAAAWEVASCEFGALAAARFSNAARDWLLA
jgi:Ca2+-binding RTX toxin-like protein